MALLKTQNSRFVNFDGTIDVQKLNKDQIACNNFIVTNTIGYTLKCQKQLNLQGYLIILVKTHAFIAALGFKEKRIGMQRTVY